MHFFDVSVKVLERPPIEDLLALLAADEGNEVSLVEERMEPRVVSSLTQLQRSLHSIADHGGHDQTLDLD